MRKKKIKKGDLVRVQRSQGWSAERYEVTSIGDYGRCTIRPWPHTVTRGVTGKEVKASLGDDRPCDVDLLQVDNSVGTAA